MNQVNGATRQQGRTLERMVATSETFLIALSYYPSYFSSLVKSIEAFRSRLEIAAAVIVLNSRAASVHSVRSALRSKSSPFHVIEHTNEGGEFGGYQAGLDFLRHDAGKIGNLLILNDTLGIHYEFYPEHMNAMRRRIDDEASSQRIVGRIDQAEQLLSLGGLTGNRWVRSNLIFIDAAALKSIDHQLYLPEIAGWVRESADPNEFFGDEVGPATKARTSKWLFEAGGWYDAAPLSPANQKRLSLKARSILQELYLTMRLEHAGTTIMDLELHEDEMKRILWKRRTSKLLRKIGLDVRPRRSNVL
jgi:hypothetical protein